MAGDPDLPGVCRDQGGQDPHDRRLARTVGAEQPEDRALSDRQVDAVEHDRLHRTTCTRRPPRSPVPSGRSRSTRPSGRGRVRVDGPAATNAVAPLRPLLLQQRDPLQQEIGERRHLQQHRLRAPTGASRSTSRPSRASSLSSSYSEMSSPIDRGELRSIRTRSIRSPATRERRIACSVSRALTRLRDRAPAGEQRLGQLADALLRRIAHREIAEQPAHHRRKRVTARIEAPHVIGEGDLGIGRHGRNHTQIPEITQICAISAIPSRSREGRLSSGPKKLATGWAPATGLAAMRSEREGPSTT